MTRKVLLAAIVAFSASGIASAQNPTTISSNFSAFAGSTENSDRLVTGLRNGAPITLTSTDAGGVTTETTIDTPTGKMGYGNVNKSLLLARQQLADVGITQPTAEQIRASLVGEPVTVPGQTTPTQLQGVLALRAQGMGWGQISKALGHNLGHVVSGKSANTPVVAPGAAKASTTGVTNASGTTASGVTTAAGGSNPGKGHGNAYGRGITTGATGTPGNSGNAGQAKGAGKGG